MKEFGKKILKALAVFGIIIVVVSIVSFILALVLKKQEDKRYDEMSVVEKKYWDDLTNKPSDEPYVAKSTQEMDLYTKLAGMWICPTSGEYVKFYHDPNVPLIRCYERYHRLGYTDYYKDYYLKSNKDIHFYSNDEDKREIEIYNSSSDSYKARELDVHLSEDEQSFYLFADKDLIYYKVNEYEYSVDNNIKMAELEVFYSNQEVWNSNVIEMGEGYEDVVLDEWYYAITDLDKDEHLEIIKSGYAGEDKTSYSVIYELQGDGSVKAVNTPDLLNSDNTYPHSPAFYKYDYMFCYIVNNDTWLYLTNASTKLGDKEYEDEYGLMVFSNNRLGLRDVVSCKCVSGDNGDSYTYYDSKHEEIDKDKYDELYKNYTSKGKRYATMKWFKEISRENLGASYNSWKVK